MVDSDMTCGWNSALKVLRYTHINTLVAENTKHTQRKLHKESSSMATYPLLPITSTRVLTFSILDLHVGHIQTVPIATAMDHS